MKLYENLYFLTEPCSVNNRILVETYQKEGLRANVSNGFARLDQKVAVKGLKVVVSAKLNDGTYVPKGSTVFIKEELLHTQPWAQKIMESEGVEGKFIIVDSSFVEYIVPPKEA